MKELIIELLGKRPNDISFTNGGGYIQHSLEKVNQAIEAFHLYATEWLNQKAVDYINSPAWLELHSIEEREKAIQEARCKTYDKTFIGRYLDDSGSDLYSIWIRLYFIDEQGREWGQPYYRFHPQHAKQIKLNLI